MKSKFYEIYTYTEKNSDNSYQMLSKIILIKYSVDIVKNDFTF